MNKQTTTDRPNFRKNADQVVNFFGHGDYTVKYLGKCPITGTRLYDLPDFAHPEYQPYILRAAEYDMSGPDFMYSWMAYQGDAKARAKALDMAKATWLPGPDKVGPTQTIHISGRRWFDKANGNTYYSAIGQVNGEIVAHINFQYGYSNQYEYEMADKLAKLGFMPGCIEFGKGRPSEQPWNYAERTGAKYTTYVTDVNRKRDM